MLFAFEATFPKPPRTLVLSVGHSSNHFARASHQPRHARQAFSQLGQPFGICNKATNFQFCGIGRSPRFVSAFGEQLPPSSSHLVVRPLFDDVWPSSQHAVKVIAHDAKGHDFHAEYGCEEFQSISNPLSSVIEVFARDRIITTQKTRGSLGTTTKLN